MTDLCKTIIEAPEWQDANLTGLADISARAALSHLTLDPSGFQISILGCDDARISTLNAEFRGMPTPTNVLSWPSADRTPEMLPSPGRADAPTELGDIAIAYQTCAAEAEAQQKSLSSHVTHLIIHGILHLFGYDHEEDHDAALMEDRETAILATLGIEDPYF